MILCDIDIGSILPRVGWNKWFKPGHALWNFCHCSGLKEQLAAMGRWISKREINSVRRPSLGKPWSAHVCLRHWDEGVYRGSRLLGTDTVPSSFLIVNPLDEASVNAAICENLGGFKGFPGGKASGSVFLRPYRLGVIYVFVNKTASGPANRGIRQPRPTPLSTLLPQLLRAHDP